MQLCAPSFNIVRPPRPFVAPAGINLSVTGAVFDSRGESVAQSCGPANRPVHLAAGGNGGD